MEPLSLARPIVRPRADLPAQPQEAKPENQPDPILAMQPQLQVPRKRGRPRKIA